MEFLNFQIKFIIIFIIIIFYYFHCFIVLIYSYNIEFLLCCIINITLAKFLNFIIQ